MLVKRSINSRMETHRSLSHLTPTIPNMGKYPGRTVISLSCPVQLLGGSDRLDQSFQISPPFPLIPVLQIKSCDIPITQLTPITPHRNTKRFFNKVPIGLCQMEINISSYQVLLIDPHVTHLLMQHLVGVVGTRSVEFKIMIISTIIKKVSAHKRFFYLACPGGTPCDLFKLGMNG